MKFNFGLKKLDLYIIKKFLGTFFYSIALIISIVVVFDIAEKIDDFIESKATISDIAIKYYLNFAPYYANMFMFLFIFISVIFFTSKMAADSEIIAILSSGVSFNRFLFPYFVSAFFLAILSFFLSGYVIPPANKVRLTFENKHIEGRYYYSNRNFHRQVSPGVFIYMQSYDNKHNYGYKFSIEKFENNRLVSKLMSNFIQWDTITKVWKIHNYNIRTINEDGSESLKQGDVIDTTLNITIKEFRQRLSVIETLNSSELNEFIEFQKKRGDENIAIYLIEKYRRIAFPFSSFILTLIGVSLSVRKTRGGTGLHIGIGILLSFSYILFMQISTQMAIANSISPLVAVWTPNIIYAIVAVFLYYLAPK